MDCTEGLADELIASRRGSRFGTNPLGLVYHFLLKVYGDPKQARADFVRFLSGELRRNCSIKRELGCPKNRSWHLHRRLVARV